MRIKIFFLFFILLLLSTHPQLSWAQYTLEPSDNPIIDKLTQKYIGQSVSLSQLDQLIKEISQDGLFQVLSVEKTGESSVRIRAQKTFKIANIEITGNSSYNNKEVLEKTKISLGQTLSQIEINQAIERVRTYYRNAGYYNFNITHEIINSNDSTLLKINIDENKYCLIEQIRFFSNNENLNNELNQLTLPFLKQNYTQTTTNEIEKKVTEYLDHNRFLISKISNSSTVFNDDKTRVKLNFTISNPIQFEFVFDGNKSFSHFDLIKVSQINGKFLYLNGSSSEMTENMIKLYLNSGFPSIQITTTENNFPELFKRVIVFDIDEGPRVRIGKINIEGKLTRNKSYYSSLFEKYLAQQTHTLYFVKENINAAAEELVNHLRREGYLMAELVSLSYEITPRNDAIITLQIDEGILTYVRQILFRGAKSFSNLELKDVIGIEPNKPLQIAQVEESFVKLTDFYKEEGFLEFEIKNPDSSVIQYQRGQPYADIVFQVSEGPQIRVRSIQVRGLQKTKEHVVTRELDFSPEDVLTYSKVTLSIDRLEKTGLFGKVNIRSLEQGSPLAERTIVIELEERKPGLFSSGVGLLSEGLLTYRGYVGAIYNNIGGKGRAISTRADLRYQESVYYLQNRVALTYYEPYLMKTRLRGRVSLVREQELSEITADQSIILSTNEVRLTTEKELSQKARLSFNVWRFANQESFRVSDLATVQNINIGSTGPVFELDYRNDPFLPTKGSYSRFEVEYSDPLLGSSRDNPEVSGLLVNGIRADARNEINYYKATFATTHYIPLTNNKKWVWVNSLHGGYLKNISSRDDSGVPRVRSFFLGGSSTIRGFSIGTTETVPGKRELCLKQGLITIGQGTEQCTFDNVFVRDDSTFVLVKSEVRFPLSGNLGGLVFYDGGGVFLGEFKLNDPYRDSVGVGLRYDTPVGAFVVEIGYKLDRKLGGNNSLYDRESDVAFHLAIGNF